MTFDPRSSQDILKALLTGKLASFVALDCLAGKTFLLHDTKHRWQQGTNRI